MGRVTFAVLMMIGISWAAAGEQVNPPPQPLHKVAGHWTPYEPPTEFPPDAQVYIIKPGDTLWDLAQRNFGNPYLWPQLWEKNQYIKDAHWIYPGDPLIIGPKTAEAAPEAPETAPPPAAAPPPPAPEAAPAAPEEAPQPLPPVAEGETAPLVAVGGESDVYCFAYLDDKGEQLPLYVAGAEDAAFKDQYLTGDILYLSGGQAEGVHPGQEFFVVSPGPELRHPATGALMGEVMRYVGHLRVLCAFDHGATAELLSTCDGVVVGDRLKPYEPIPVPMSLLTPPVTRCDLPNDKAKGYIVYSKDEQIAFGQDHVVMVDLGEADQAAPGTLCTVYRENPAPDVPRQVIGELAILTAGDHWATAKIIRSSGPMWVGDRVEIK
jgi:LysM domain